jgi:pimeloyl-ACP methyl ester carboxylesterase
MNRRELLGAAAATTALGMVQSATAEEQQMEKGFVTVNGQQMYFERHGKGGTPLVLLHGAFSAIGTSFGAMLPRLAATREVIAFELQAHGHTPDSDRTLRLETLAADVAAGLEQLGVSQADVMGYSLGAGVALQLVLDRPNLVRKLVLTSLAYSSAAYPPGYAEMMQTIEPEMLMGSPWQLEYAGIAPNPDGFAALVGKIKEFSANLADFDEAQLKAIAQPVLLISGDIDNASVEHMAAFHKLVGGTPADPMSPARSWLLILPGTSHAFVPERGDLIVPAVDTFLAI